jgi:signal transduction histidine kinase
MVREGRGDGLPSVDRDDQCGDVATLLPPSPLSAKAARDFTRDVLESWQLQEFCDDVVLVVDELVSNAVRYAEGPIIVALRRDVDAVQIQVIDESNSIPVVLPQSQTRDGGRGLAIVDDLSGEWGADRHMAGGKTVWARIVPP